MDYYDSIAPGYDELHGEEQAEKLRIIAGELKPKRNDRVLDVGCGTFLSYGIFGCDIYGIDPSEKLVCEFRKKHPRESERAKIGSAEDLLDHFSGKFDFIICVTAAHHFSDAKKAFDAMKALSHQKTRLAFSLLKKGPSTDDLVSLIEREFEVHKVILEEKDIMLFCTVP